MEKLLIVSEPKQTTMYMTLKSPDAIHIVKRMLETLLFEPFGDVVLKRADKSLHPMNLKGKTSTGKWQLACEFQTVEEAKEDDRGKRARRKGPAIERIATGRRNNQARKREEVRKASTH